MRRSQIRSRLEGRERLAAAGGSEGRNEEVSTELRPWTSYDLEFAVLPQVYMLHLTGIVC